MLEPVDIDDLDENVVNIKQTPSASKDREIPSDLYIPADALEVITQDFEGPLDLLLYLIRKNSFDVLNIPVAEVAEQYAKYIDLMQKIQLELAGEYLAMAATLAQIKSRLLLPPRQRETEDEEEIDPRLELALRLQEYEKIRAIAKLLDKRPRIGREIFMVHAHGTPVQTTAEFEKVELAYLIEAFQGVLQLAESSSSIVMHRETMSVKEKVESIVEVLRDAGQLPFGDLFDRQEGKAGIVIAFLAILELINSKRVYAIQATADSPIHIHLNE